MAVSITTLCYISIDRYIGICVSNFNKHDIPHPRYIIPFIWLIVFLFFIPASLYCKRSIRILDNSCDCLDDWPSQMANVNYHVIMVVTWLIVPFSLMTFCYLKILRKLKSSDIKELNDPNRSKRRSVKMLVLSTTMFFISWLPYACLFLLKKLQIGNQKIIR